KSLFDEAYLFVLIFVAFVFFVVRLCISSPKNMISNGSTSKNAVDHYLENQSQPSPDPQIFVPLRLPVNGHRLRRRKLNHPEHQDQTLNDEQPANCGQRNSIKLIAQCVADPMEEGHTALPSMSMPPIA